MLCTDSVAFARLKAHKQRLTSAGNRKGLAIEVRLRNLPAPERMLADLVEGQLSGGPIDQRPP